MVLQLANRVKEVSTTTGTGTYDLSGAVTGFQSFVAGIGDGNTCYYCATDDTDWEIGIGTVTDGSPDTLARTEILESSNSDSAVNWGAGTRTIFCTFPAEKALDVKDLLTVVEASGESIFELTFDNDNYSSFEIEMVNFTPDADSAHLYFQMKRAGQGSFDGGSTDYQYFNRGGYSGSGSTNAAYSSGGSSVASITEHPGGAGWEIGSGAGEEGISGVIKVHRPKMLKKTGVTWNTIHFNTSNDVIHQVGGAFHEFDEEVIAILIAFASADGESGQLRLYGIR